MQQMAFKTATDVMRMNSPLLNVIPSSACRHRHAIKTWYVLLLGSLLLKKIKKSSFISIL